MALECATCKMAKKCKYKDYSKENELNHLQHIKDCIHYANRYLIRLLSNKCKIEQRSKRSLLLALIQHKGIQKYYIYQNQTLFTELFSTLNNPNYHQQMVGITTFSVLPLISQQQFKWISTDCKMIHSLHGFMSDCIESVLSDSCFDIDSPSLSPLHDLLWKWRKYEYPNNYYKTG